MDLLRTFEKETDVTSFPECPVFRRLAFRESVSPHPTAILLCVPIDEISKIGAGLNFLSKFFVKSQKPK